MTLLLIFSTSMLAGFSGAIAPGPLLALNIREASRRGVWVGPNIILGHALLELLLVIGLAQGLGRLLEAGPVVGTIGIIGGLFLIWMGWTMLANPIRQPETASGGSWPARGVASLALAGVLVSLSNPYFLIWWATVGASLMIQSLQGGAAGLAFFYVGHIFADFTWYSVVSLAMASGRRVMSQAFYRGISIGCGVFLIALGIYFIYSGTGFLR